MKQSAQWYGIGCCILFLTLAGCDYQTSTAEQKTNTGHQQQSVAVLETHIQPLALEDDMVQTRYGKLEIVRSQQEMPPDTLKLDGKQIFREEAFYLSLHQYITQNDRDLVLFGSNCGGTGCPENHFYLAVLEKNAEPAILTQENFVAYPDDLKVKTEGEKLIIDLGFAGGKHKVATLQGKELKIALEDVPKTFLGEEDCQWLQTDAIDACIEYRESDEKCADPQSEFSGYLSRGVVALSNYPGFVTEAFDRHCKAACETGKRPDYETFAKEVCSK